MDSTTFMPPPTPRSELERYRLLATTAGVKVSPLVLGGMSIGTAYADTLGPLDKAQSFELLDAFHEAGGNFIDTASNYQQEQSEKIIGEWMQARGNRDQIFLATKCATNYRAWEMGKGPKVANYGGNSRKTIRMSLRDSLAKLQTDYVDLFFMHFWDYSTGVEEVMDTLHQLVAEGKVLYLGISNAPAWVVSAANAYAQSRGRTPFSVYQGRWNVLRRDIERDVIPMTRHYGMAVMPWDVLGSGKFKSAEQVAAQREGGGKLRTTLGADLSFTTDQSEDESRISRALGAVAAELGDGVTLQQVALAYVRQKAHNVFPIVGGRKVAHLRDNIRALSLRLSPEQMARLEGEVPFAPGYPHDLIGFDPRESDEPSWLSTLGSHVEYPRAGITLRPLR